jgi:peptidoglycan/LPS O-acetylase OafA/YrhL
MRADETLPWGLHVDQAIHMDDKKRVPATPVDRERDLAIDMAKGCAILWVLLIHSEAQRGDLLFRQVVNQAVPVFIVLFGLNSTLWWRGRELRTNLAAWYRRAISRLMVPVWATLVVWWALVLYFHPFGVKLTWKLPFVHVLGYLLYVGTGWFVTMILQLVVLFPALEWARRRLGMGVLLAIGLAITAACTWYGLALLGFFSRWPGGQFNYYVFSPRFAGHVVFGMFLAEHRRQLTPAVGVLAGVVLAGCAAVDVAGLERPWVHECSWIGALALTVVLLVSLRPARIVPLAAPALVWLGRSSYGVYLGQLLTHNFFVYWLTIPGVLDGMNRWLYTVILLAGGLFFVWLGERLLRLAAVVEARLGSTRKALDTPRAGSGS